MKDQFSLIIAVVAFGFLGARLYQKYIKKDKPGSKPTTGSSKAFSSVSKDDNYEPYSKK